MNTTAKRLRDETLDRQAKRDIEHAERVGEQVLDNAKTDPRKGWYDEIAAYMAPFKKYPVLKDPKDFAFLFGAYKNGTETERLRARDLMVYGNIRLVLKVALRHTGRSYSLLDLIQEGVIGLMTALEKYDINHETGARFSTYAQGWIRQSISRALVDKNEMEPYRIPVHFHELISKVRRTCGELYLEHGRWPKPIDVYARIKESDAKNVEDLRLADIVAILQHIQLGETVRLDAPASREGEGDDTVADRLNVGPPKTETIVEARRLYAEYRKALENIEAAVDALPARTAMVVRLRLGLGDFEIQTLEEISVRYDVTRERIRQIEAKALGELETKLGISADEISEIVDIVQELEVIAHAI